MPTLAGAARNRRVGNVGNVGSDGGLLLAECRFLPGVALPLHEHDRPRLGMPIDGGFVRLGGGAEIPHAPFSLSFIPAGWRHGEVIDPVHGATCLAVEMAPGWQARQEEIAPLPDEPVSLPSAQGRAWGWQFREELRADDRFSALALEGLVLEALSWLGRAAAHARTRMSTPPPWLERARELVESDVSASLDLATIGRAVGVHPVHLARSFRDHFGLTVGEYARRKRIELVCRRLRETDEPLVQLALATGFSDQSHLSRTFRRVVGVTPTAYRGRHGR